MICMSCDSNLLCRCTELVYAVTLGWFTVAAKHLTVIYGVPGVVY